MKSPKKGAVTFEWILLHTTLLIGLAGGYAILRDALIIESSEVADAILHNNKSYIASPPAEVTVSYNGKGDSQPYSYASYASGSHYIEPFVPGTAHRVILEVAEVSDGSGD